MKYPSGRQVVRKAGKFAKQPTLEILGYPINSSGMKYVCKSCGYEWAPILIPKVCPNCQVDLGQLLDDCVPTDGE